MCNAVGGHILFFAGAIIECQHARADVREVMLEGQQLAAIPQGALCQKADFRQAIHDDARRVQAIDSVENQLDGFAELEI